MKAYSLFALFVLLSLSVTCGPRLRAEAQASTAASATEQRDQEGAGDSSGDKKQTASAAVVETDTAMPEENAVEKAEAVESKSAEPADKAAEEIAPPPPKKPHQIKNGTLHTGVEGNRYRGAGNRVQFMDDNEVPAGLVVKGDAFTVLGDLTVDGEVMHDAVTVLGDTVINGTVHHNVVAFMGDLTLGPKARVEGDITIAGGEIHRDPEAVVIGRVHQKAVDGKFNSADNWWGKTLRLGRPLAIGAHLGWLWILTGFSVAFYALLALIFPRSVCNCGDKLVQQPGLTILAAVLGMLALPVLFILLFITVVGIPVAILLLPMGCILAVLFGKAAVYTLVGRKISQGRLHPAVAAIVGASIFVVLYLLPVIGLLLSVLVALIGFGCVILTLFASEPQVISSGGVPPPVTEKAAGAVPPPIVRHEPIIPPVAGGGNNPVGLLPHPPRLPVFSATTLPRAGFWIRMAAAFLDAMLIGMLVGITESLFHSFFHPGKAFPFWVVMYSVIMWATRGTTIGGVICGLRVVRLDDRPVGWGIAIVRALGGFLSISVAGLGFIWVAFDDEKQSWHDKIAGTTVVHVPKGTALL